MFYIGGRVQVRPSYSLDHLADLTRVLPTTAPTAVAAPPSPTAMVETLGLETYYGQNAPGQHWKCYRSRAHDEKDRDKNLTARLTEMLTPSTPQEYLDSIPKREGYSYCPYLRLVQKQMTKEDWLGDGELHPGAHFPLCLSLIHI